MDRILKAFAVKEPTNDGDENQPDEEESKSEEPDEFWFSLY